MSEAYPEIRLNDYQVTVEMTVRVKAASYDQAMLLAERFQPSIFAEAPGFRIETENGVDIKKIRLA